MLEYEKKSDEELIELLRTGESEILDYLLEKYRNLVKKKAHTLYLVGGETDDLIQEGMTGLFKAVRDFQPEEKVSFAAFANLCVERQMYTAVRHSNRQKNLPLNSYISISGDEEHLLGDLQAENPENIILEKEKLFRLQKRIHSILSPMENKVLGYYMNGESTSRIAEQLNRQPKSIYNALQRIREKIRKCLDQKDEIPEE